MVIHLIGRIAAQFTPGEAEIGHGSPGFASCNVSGNGHHRMLKIAEIMHDYLAMRSYHCHDTFGQAFQNVENQRI